MTTHHPHRPPQTAKQAKKGVSPPPEAKVGNLLVDRPTELASGLGLAAAVYGFMAEAGADNVLAAIIGIVVGVLPYVISEFVDRIRRKQPDPVTPEVVR